MYKSLQELTAILRELLKNPENEYIEFKEAKDNFEIDKLGKYFSAISNETTLKNKQYGWIIFGVKDINHIVTGTNFNGDNDFNKIKKQVADNTTDNITFIEIYPFEYEGKRVIMFQVPAAAGTPTNWKGYPYGRTGESLVPLAKNKIEQIRATGSYDWSRRVIDGATINHLDKEAIQIARKQFKMKNSGKEIAEEIDNISDIDFLNKAKLIIDGKITNTAMLLLGKNEYDYLIEDYHPQITWKLCDEKNIVDYEHFGIPFIINIDKAREKVRNLKYRYMIDDNSIFPNEVDQYDNYILRELLNNCIAHQDYRLKGIINIIEFKDKVMVTNEGDFIPKKVENVLQDGYSSPYYRNQFLAAAMVNLNMIDTVGSGIKRIYNIQKEKYFPMPDYDLSEDNRVKVTLYGKIIDEKYSKILFEKTNLDINQIMLLDRVQKGYQITKEQSDYLRKNKLIEGRYPNIYISATIAEKTGNKIDYMNRRGIDNKCYVEYIREFLNNFGSATRQDINALIYPMLPLALTEEEKNKRVRYLLTKLRKQEIIINIGSDTKPIWKIKTH